MHQGQDIVLLPSRRRRRHYSLEHKMRLAQLCSGSRASLCAVAQANDINPNLLRRWVRDFGQGLLCATPEHTGFMSKPEPPVCNATSLESDPKPDFFPVRFNTASSATPSNNNLAGCTSLDIQVRRGELVVQIQAKQVNLAKAVAQTPQAWERQVECVHILAHQPY